MRGPEYLPKDEYYGRVFGGDGIKDGAYAVRAYDGSSMAVRLLPGAIIPSAATLDAAAAAFSALPETGRIPSPLVYNLATGAVLEAWHDRAAPEDVPSSIRFRPPTGNVAQCPWSALAWRSASRCRATAARPSAWRS